MAFIDELLEKDPQHNWSFIIFTACPSNLVIHVRCHHWDCNILLGEQQILESHMLKANT